MTVSRPSLPASRKRKASTADAFTQIEKLEKDLTTAISNASSLNPLVDLLDTALTTEDPAHLSKAIYALYRVFVLILSKGLLLGGESADEGKKAVRAWLMERFNAYVELLTGLLKDEDATLRTSALRILFSLQKHLSASLNHSSSSSSSTQPQFHLSHFRKIVHALLRCPPSQRRPVPSKQAKTGERGLSRGLIDPDVRQLFVEEWFDHYDDIRWFFLREAGNILNSKTPEESPSLPENLLSILEGLTTFPTEQSELNAWWVEELASKPSSSKTPQGDPEDEDAEDNVHTEIEDDWRKFFDEETPAAHKPKGPSARLHTMTLHQSLHSLASHRAVFTRAWLSLLPRLSALSTSKANALRVLNILHRGIIPYLTRPVLIMDWVGTCVDYGGTVGLLALNALFTLMKEYNLDYPSFYTRLYAFLDRDVLHLRHRARFFRLTELFLSSTHLPAALVAGFVKRLSRLSLNAPPAAVVMIIPFVYNLLKRHPALMRMIHRVDEAEAENDIFKMEESNPALSGALDSSIWELYTHKHHYHVVVSTLACIFEEAFTRPAYAMEDFLDHTYGTLFDTESQRRIRKEPPVIEDLRPSLEESTIDSLWAF